MTASEPIRFSFSEKEKLRKRKTAHGVPPRSELHYFAAGRSGEIMNSRRLRPPETPRGTGKPGAVTDRDGVHSGESFRIRGKTCSFGEPQRHDPNLGFPLRAAKQGRGNESVSGGDREPRLTEPQRDSSARRR